MTSSNPHTPLSPTSPFTPTAHEDFAVSPSGFSSFTPPPPLLRRSVTSVSQIRSFLPEHSRTASNESGISPTSSAESRSDDEDTFQKIAKRRGISPPSLDSAISTTPPMRFPSPSVDPASTKRGNSPPLVSASSVSPPPMKMPSPAGPVSTLHNPWPRTRSPSRMMSQSPSIREVELPHSQLYSRSRSRSPPLTQVRSLSPPIRAPQHPLPRTRYRSRSRSRSRSPSQSRSQTRSPSLPPIERLAISDEHDLPDRPYLRTPSPIRSPSRSRSTSPLSNTPNDPGPSHSQSQTKSISISPPASSLSGRSWVSNNTTVAPPAEIALDPTNAHDFKVAPEPHIRYLTSRGWTKEKPSNPYLTQLMRLYHIIGKSQISNSMVLKGVRLKSSKIPPSAITNADVRTIRVGLMRVYVETMIDGCIRHNVNLSMGSGWEGNMYFAEVDVMRRAESNPKRWKSLATWNDPYEVLTQRELCGAERDDLDILDVLADGETFICDFHCSPHIIRKGGDKKPWVLGITAIEGRIVGRF